MFKNIVSVLFIVLLLINFSLLAAAQTNKIIEKIYAHYPLDGNLLDQGPHQLHGENLDKKRGVEDRFGNKNSALIFTEKKDSVTLPVNINPTKMPQFTAAFWFKIDEISATITLFTNSDGGFARSIVIDNRNKQPLLSVSAGSRDVYGGIGIPLNKWIFTAVSWNAETESVSLYLADQNKNFSSISTNNINPKDADQFIRLAENHAADNFFQLTIDELMIWDQILTRDEIRKVAF